MFFNNATDYTSTLLAPPDDSSDACDIRQLRLMVHRESYLKYSADIHELLSALPSDLISEKQRAISRCGKRWQMSIADDDEDAFSVMLQSLLKIVTYDGVVVKNALEK